MNLGTGIAVCAMWAALAAVLWTYRKDFSPFGVVVCLAIGARAPTMLARVRL
jgi:hypothetical protein